MALKLEYALCWVVKKEGNSQMDRAEARIRLRMKRDAFAYIAGCSTLTSAYSLCLLVYGDKLVRNLSGCGPTLRPGVISARQPLWN